MNTTALVVTNTDVAIQPRTSIDTHMYDRYFQYLDVKQKTAQTYARALRQMFKYLAENNIEQPTRDDLIAYREHLRGRVKPATVQAYVTAMRLFFKWAALEGLYPDVAEHLKGAKIERDHKKDYLNSTQTKKILKGIDRSTLKGVRDYAILTTMFTGGLRTIEVSRANIEDLRTLGNDAVLYVQGKGKDEKNEFVKIPAPVEDAIRAYLKARGTTPETAPLFTSTSNNSKGGRLSTRSISGIVKGYLQAAGFDSDRLTAHSLRHTAVTLSLLAGKSLQEVQQFARHANIATTQIYAHNLDRAANQCSAAVAAAIF